MPSIPETLALTHLHHHYFYLYQNAQSLQEEAYFLHLVDQIELKLLTIANIQKSDIDDFDIILN